MKWNTDCKWTLNFILFIGTAVAIKIKIEVPTTGRLSRRGKNFAPPSHAIKSRGDIMRKRLTSRRENAENTGSTLVVLYIFSMIRVMAFIFHMCIPCDKMFLLMPKWLTSWPWILLFKNFNIGHIFWMVSDMAFIFHMCISYYKTFLLVP
jgi:hypothetical protein